MKQIMPSGGKGKGLHKFSALSINENARASLDAAGSSESGSKGEGSGEGEGSREGEGSGEGERSGEGEGSGGTVGMPSTPVETANAARDVEMPFDPLPTPASQSLASAPVSSAPFNNVSSTMHATVDLNSGQSGVPSMPTTFTPPTAPSSFNGSSVSSIKPSSSISARIEVTRRKRKADEDISSVASSSLTKPSSTSSARKRRTGNAVELSRVGDQLQGLRDNINEHFDTFGSAVSDISARVSSRHSREKAKPLAHPSVHLARQKLLQIDKARVLQSEIASLFALFEQDLSFTDAYLQLAEDPNGLAEARHDWLKREIVKMGTSKL